MKIAAITVWYNPTEDEKKLFLNNTKTYLNYVDKIFIVDNSKNNNSDIFENLSNYIYLYNGNLNGIAGALNKGCCKAIEENFEWVLTMDQDSFFEEEQILNFIKLSENIIQNEKNIASIAPTIRNTSQITRRSIEDIVKNFIKNKLGKQKKETTSKNVTSSDNSFVFETRIITSGNLINLDVWKKINGFYELLFIDNVDFDYCYKLTRCGFKIIRFLNVFMCHNIGTSNTLSLFRRKTPLENDFRLYYIIRNFLIENYRFPEYKEFHKDRLHAFLFDYLINTFPPFYKIKVFIKAYRDFKKLKRNNQILPFSYENY